MFAAVPKSETDPQRTCRPSSYSFRTSVVTSGGRVGGSPFKTFAEAEKACEAMLAHLTK